MSLFAWECANYEKNSGILRLKKVKFQGVGCILKLSSFLSVYLRRSRRSRSQSPRGTRSYSQSLWTKSTPKAKSRLRSRSSSMGVVPKSPSPIYKEKITQTCEIVARNYLAYFHPHHHKDERKVLLVFYKKRLQSYLDVSRFW